MKTKTIAFNALLLLTFVVFQFSCKKNDDNPGTPAEQAKVTGTVAGKITDEAGSPVIGATVTMEGITATSNLFGLFVFKKVLIPKDRSTLKIVQQGMAEQYVGFRPSANNICYLQVIMLKPETTGIVNGANGGTASLPSGASATFPPNAFEKVNGNAYLGDVTVKMMYLNADDDQYVKKSPGQDLHALDANGNMKMLYSFGMMNVELRSDAGEILQLASGKSASLAFPVSSVQTALAPATIPMWYFDTEKKIWREEGTAIKNGNSYLGTVRHFTWWNCDQTMGIATLQTSVLGCDGITRVPNISVSANYHTNAYTTDSQGNISSDAPAGYSNGTFTIKAVENSNSVSQLVTIPVLSPGQVYQAADLLLLNGPSATPLIKGTLVDCNQQPTDGFVVFSNKQSGEWTYQYVTGTFTSIVDANADYKITAISDGKFAQADIGALPGSCVTTDLGNIVVCSSITVGNANFNLTITSALLGTQSAGYFVDSCQVSYQAAGYYNISLAGVDTTNGSYGFMVMSAAAYTPGNYYWDGNLNKIYFSANINGVPVTISGTLTGTNILFATPSPGGFVEAAFAGNVNISSTSMPGLIVPGTIDGNFKVLRNF